MRVGPRGLARLREQHQRERARDLVVVRERLPELAREPDRLARQLAVEQRVARAARVALVEHEVQHVEHRGDARRELVRRRPPEARSGLPQRGPRAAQPLAHRGLGDEEGGGDLRRAQAGDGAQRERDLRGPRQRRVAAEQQQLERVVAAGRRRRWLLGRRELAVRARRVGPRAVDQPPRGDGDQPAARVLGRAGSHCFAAASSASCAASSQSARSPCRAQQRREDVRRLAPPHVLELALVHPSSPPGHIVARSSTVSPGLANCEAISSARSWLSTSIRKKPARCSLASE